MLSPPPPHDAPAVIERWNQNLLDALRKANISVAQLAGQFNLKRGTIYKRLRGESPWPIGDYLRLSDRFGLDVDPGTSPSHLVRLRRPPKPELFSQANYVGTLATFAEAFTEAGYRMRVSTHELPVFYLYAEPALAALKLYLFRHTQGRGALEVFDIARQTAAHRADIETLGRVAEQYVATPREEIWGRAPLADLRGQMAYLRRERLLDAPTAEAIDADIRRVCEDLRTRIHPGQAEGLELRYQPLHTTSPLFQLHSPRAPLQSFLTFDSPNYLAAEGEHAHAMVSEHFERAWAMATPLTGNPGEVDLYFGRLTYGPPAVTVAVAA